MTVAPTIAVVGSGPIGSTYARLLLEALPDARVIMFEAGPQVTPRPGESVRNLTDPDEKARAREMSQGPQAGQYRDSLGILAGAVVEGMFTARGGTHLLDFGGEGSAHVADFPAAAAATNVGGQGAHWTCAIPDRRSARSSTSSATTSGKTSSRPPRACCTSRARRSRTRPWGRRSAPCSTGSSPTNCPRATA